jgi:membrane fusion protein (multidrug efflux system)
MSTETADPVMPPRSPRRRVIRLTILVAVLAVAGYFIMDWVQRRQANVFIIDSRIASDMINVGAQEGGLITGLEVGTGDTVSRGQVLVRMDTRTLEQQATETRASILRLDAEREQLNAEQVLERARIKASEETAGARIAVSTARRKSVDALLAQAVKERKRAEDLHRRKIIAGQAVDNARAAEADLSARVLEAKAAIVEAEAELRRATAERERKGVMIQRKAAVEAERESMRARLQQLETRLADRDVPAIVDGVVDQTFVEVGEYVRPGQRLLMIHDPDNVWVAANVKETELYRFNVGSRTTVTVDAYPGRTFEGKITWIAPAATSQFALLPNPNPSGNFTKVTQRVPIRIDLQGDRQGLRPGMMVEVAIHVEK